MWGGFKTYAEERKSLEEWRDSLTPEERERMDVAADREIQRLRQADERREKAASRRKRA
jgi:hypothetical protein